MIRILLFGVLAEKAGIKEISMTGSKTLDVLLKEIYSSYPSLSKAKFKISVNKTLISDLTVFIEEGSELALLPPFSGG